MSLDRIYHASLLVAGVNFMVGNTGGTVYDLVGRILGFVCLYVFATREREF